MPAPTISALDFELLFGALPAAHMVLAPDGTMLALNTAMAALLPADATATLPGQPVAALRTSAAAAGAILPSTAQWEAGLAAAQAGTQQVLMPGQLLNGAADTAPYRYWQVTLQPVHSPPVEGQPRELRYVLVRLLDVSEQLRTTASFQQHEQLARLTEGLPQLLWTATAEGLVNYANQAWYDYTGLTPIETYGQGWLAAVHPNDRETAAARWQHYVQSGENSENMYRLRHAATGQYRWHLSRATTQRDAEGRLQQWVGTITDIHSQQVAAERQREQREQDNRLLNHLDQLPLYLVTMRGPRHEVDYISATARPFLPADAAGQEAAQLSPGPNAATLAAFDEVYRTGESRHVGHIQSSPLAAPAGALPHYLDVTALPLRGADGSVEGVLMSGIDVTDRLAFEEQMAAVTAETQRKLEIKEARQRRILDQLPSYIATYEGPELRLSYLSPNHEELLGGAHAQVGQTLREAAPELAEQGLEVLLRTVYETGQPYQAFEQELQFRVPATGERRPRFLNFGYYPLYGAENRTEGILAFAQDVTEQVLARRQAEALQAEARAADRRLRRMTESLPSTTFISDENGQILYLSPQWYSYAGLSPADDINQLWASFIHPDDLPQAQQQVETALATGQPWRYEFRMRRHDGQYRWFLSEGVPEPAEEALAAGRPRQWFGSNLDVDDLKQAQHQLELKDRHLSQILGQVPAFIATFEGPEHRYTFINSSYEQLTNGRPSIGMPVAVARPEAVEQGFVALLDQVYRSGETLEGRETRALIHHPVTGETRELFVDFSFQALRDAHNEVKGLLSFSVDVTDRVRAQQQAEELQARVQRRDLRLRLMTESLPLISYISSADGLSTEYLSPQWFTYTGTDPATYDPDTEWAQAIYPDDIAPMVAAFEPALQARCPWTGELRLRRHDGQYRWHLTRSVPELDPETGELLRWYGSTTDVHELRETQSQLELKEQQMSQILRQSPALIATLEGPEHRFTFTNPAYDVLVGNRARLGARAADCLPEMVEQGFIELLDTVYGTGEPFIGQEISLELTNPTTGQPQVYHLDFTYQALQNRQGQIVGILAFIVDVTERVAARRHAEALQADMRQRDERLRALTAAVPVFIFSYSPAGQLTYVNPYFFEYTGLDPEGSADQIWATVNPDDSAAAAVRFTHSLESGTPWEANYRVRRADGEYRWCQTKVQPLLAAGGEVLGYSGATVEIHEQYELQERLRGSEEQFRVLANAIPQLAWITDNSGYITWYNQGWYDFTGTTLEEMIGWGWEKVHHIDHIGHVVASWKHSIQTGTPWEDTFLLRRHTGEFEWFLSRAIPIRDDSGQIIRWFGTNTNVHAMRELQLRLQQQNDALLRTNQDLDNFVYTASHDLKQPINNMAGIFEELTRTAYFRDSEAAKLIVYFERALKQIFGTIEDLSAIVQVQRQQGEVTAEEVALAPLVAEIISSVQDQVNQQRATFELNFDTYPRLPFVRANLQSILFNLISNSLKYAAPGRPPHIRIWCTPAAATGRPVLTVQDNGLGIDLERFGSQLFQLFRRFHTHVDGSGMGLYLVNRIVQNHGGQVEVDSTVGEGTAFRLYL
jgi:PAS domain S-box-containing protein